MNSSDPRYQKIIANGWQLSLPTWSAMNESGREFAFIELGDNRTSQAYARRLRRIGFTDMDTIFDAGCGIGQWSVSFSRHNRRVIGYDINAERIGFAQTFSAENCADNVQFGCHPVEDTGLEDTSVDAVFCYGVFMFLNMPKAVSEFHRILKPEGKVYLNANTWGWYLHLLLDRGLRNRSFTGLQCYTAAQRKAWIRAVFAFFRAYLRGANTQKIVTEAYLRKLLLQDRRFSIIDLEHEGGITLQKDLASQPFYPPKFYGLRSMIEVLAVRK